MKHLQALAQAALDVAHSLPKGDLPALADAVLRLLDQKGLSQKRTLFIRILRRMLAKENITIPLTLQTPSGSAGKHTESIASFLRLSLGKPVEVHESADAHLLGGALLAYRDERFDASLRSTLAALSRHLSSPLSYDAQ